MITPTRYGQGEMKDLNLKKKKLRLLLNMVDAGWSIVESSHRYLSKWIYYRMCKAHDEGVRHKRQ